MRILFGKLFAGVGILGFLAGWLTLLLIHIVATCTVYNVYGLFWAVVVVSTPPFGDIGAIISVSMKHGWGNEFNVFVIFCFIIAMFFQFAVGVGLGTLGEKLKSSAIAD